MTVAIVTDSTAYLAAEVAALAGIHVVPLQVVVAGTAFTEGVEIDVAQVAAALRGRSAVSTSRPSPQTFLDAYQQAADEGADAIVSLHLSAALSGTFESAVLAARDSPVPTHVIDSRSVGAGLGLLVLQAARSAQAGAEPAEIVATAEARAVGSRAYFSVATLEHLRRGGRIGAAAALVGSALAIKPLLLLDDGVIVPLEKVRTNARAIARLEELVVGAAAGRPVEVAVQHLDAPSPAHALADRLAGKLGAAVPVVEVGAVVGAHVGPGLIAVVLVPQAEQI